MLETMDMDAHWSVRPRDEPSLETGMRSVRVR